MIPFILVPSWWARMPAIVVFPNPLGPEKRICQSWPCLFCALSMAVAKTDFIGSWPINWSKVSGLWDTRDVSHVSSQIFFISIFFLTDKSSSSLCGFSRELQEKFRFFRKKFKVAFPPEEKNPKHSSGILHDQRKASSPPYPLPVLSER